MSDFRFWIRDFGLSARPKLRAVIEAKAPKTKGQRPKTRRSAFTLIELLVAITIIGMLAALALGGMWRAQSQARVANTKSLVSKLNARIMSAFDSYRSRRLPINPQLILASGAASTQGTNALAWCNFLWKNRGSLATDSLGLVPGQAGYPSAMQMAAVNLAAMRELQKYEMPDDWYDVIDINSGGPPYASAKVFVLPTVPGTALMYLAQFNAAASVSGITQAQLLDNGPAELLYLVLTMGPGQTELSEEFDLRHIGDIDGDGLLEFHDAWLPGMSTAYSTTVPATQSMNRNSPIFWIRWPAGYVDDPTATPPLVGLDSSPLYAPGATTATAITLSDAYHDPFDPLKLDVPAAQTGPARGYALKPLVYSAGPDLSRGLQVNGLPNTVDPYAPNSGVLKGSPIDPSWTDNVNNRNFSGRVQ